MILASENGHKEVMAKLLANGADITTQDKVRIVEVAVLNIRIQLSSAGHLVTERVLK